MRHLWRATRTESVPGPSLEPGMVQLIIRASNSRIPGMLTPSLSRIVTSILLFLALLFAARGNAQNWAGAEELLAGKIVSAAGPRTMAVEVVNRSSLSSATSDDIRRNLLTQLAALGVRLVVGEQGAVVVRISLSEDLQSYLWIAEIRQSADASAPSVVMVALPRPAVPPLEPEAATMVLRKTPLWSQPERILDVAVIDGSPTRTLVLDANAVTSYRLQDSRWQPEQALPVTHSRAWPRDLRGRLVLGKDREHVFDAYLPGVHCRGSAMPLTMTCNETDDPWPLGADPFNLNAPFVASRNFFGGALSPGVDKHTTAPPFYSAAALPRPQGTWWLLATIDGRVHLLDGSTDQVLEKLGWGSDIAGIRSGCGSGWQVLATGNGEGTNDVVRAFEVTGREPVAASATLDVSGTITGLWTESTGSSATAVVRNSETGSYEAIRLTLACNR